MMVTFVSQCEKHALKRTRRVLDAFANRIGDNTWQTLITEEGLLTVKKNVEAKRESQYCCQLSLDTLSLTFATSLDCWKSK
ncbi:hypothetical protein O7C57_12730 [Providencia sp. 21OH12SH02B-Prov]|uniref:hypothetical protein n=1 Tax=Providencia sp. 21OH12SH02B-Prov TaxID=3015951 RepID=UPI0022B72490|nr:hypothetical protein O7C57_12730 [Providencia sp. 21OH12SH02B-Prov]